MAFLGIAVPHQVARLLKDIEVEGEKTQDSEYHITVICFEDDFSTEDAGKALNCTFKVLQNFKPFLVSAEQVNCFPKGKNGTPVILTVDSKELHKLNEKLKKAYDEEGIKFSKLHKEYKPHITLSYSPEDVSSKKIESIEFMVHEIQLWAGDHGDDKFFITFPLKNEKYSEVINHAELFSKLSSKNTNTNTNSI